MRFQFLGTGASEGFPALFCNCTVCSEARRLGGKNLRLRSALLVNDDLLVDFGPDLLAAAQRLNLNLWKVRTGLVTHTHEDHFNPDNFFLRPNPFGGGPQIPVMRLYGSKDVATELTAKGLDLEKARLEIQTVSAFESWQDSGYNFTAFRAYHAIDHLDALFYSIEVGKRAILYATDTGYFPEETWQALQGRSFDAIILEETVGSGSYDQHLSFDTFPQVLERIHTSGMLRPGGRVLAHHFSHSGNPLHDELTAFFAPHGAEAAYDGMEVVLPG